MSQNLLPSWIDFQLFLLSQSLSHLLRGSASGLPRNQPGRAGTTTSQVARWSFDLDIGVEGSHDQNLCNLEFGGNHGKSPDIFMNLSAIFRLFSLGSCGCPRGGAAFPKSEAFWWPRSLEQLQEQDQTLL